LEPLLLAVVTLVDLVVVVVVAFATALPLLAALGAAKAVVSNPASNSPVLSWVTNFFMRSSPLCHSARGMVWSKARGIIRVCA
jgi:hypothetical protein